MTTDLKLASLLASRICHDLISPVGAIGNGVELLEMTDGAAADEIGLIGESARTAQAALRFMRIAFGAGADTEQFAAADLGRIARAHLETARLTIAWPGEAQDVSRADAKLTLLTAMAGASALPLGGVMTVRSLAPSRPRIALSGPRISLEADHAALLREGCGDASPRTVHLLLLGAEAAARGLVVRTSFAEDGGAIELA